MQLHANAKLVPSMRLLLVRRVLDEHWKVAEAAASMGVSERTVYRWLARWRAGDRRLVDRSSAPRRVPRRTPKSVEAMIERLRRLRFTSTRIAAELQMAVSTVGAVLARLGLNRLSRLEPPEPPNRYERRRPGELVHLDIKQLGRVRASRPPGHRSPRPGAAIPPRWLGIRPRRRRRLLPARLRRGPHRPARRFSDRLPRPHARLVHRSWREGARNHDRQRQLLHRPRLRCRVPNSRTPSPPNPTAPAAHQRQSRTTHSNAVARVGLRRHLPHQPTPRSGAHTLARLLQPATTPRRPRSPTTSLAATRRLTNVSGIYN